MNLARLLAFPFLLNAADEGATSTPAAAAAPAQAAPAAKTEAAKPASGSEEPHWLKPRLEQAKSAVLKELGVDDIDSAKKAIADARAKADAEKTAAEKAAEYKAKLDAESAEKARLSSTIAEHAARMMVGLTEAQQTAVKAVAGDDAAAQLKAIGALAPTWAKEEAAKAAATPAAAAKPATTSPAPSAPSGTTTSSPNARASYQEMRAKNPFAAAAYGLQHPDAYDAKG